MGCDTFASHELTPPRSDKIAPQPSGTRAVAGFRAIDAGSQRRSDEFSLTVVTNSFWSTPAQQVLSAYKYGHFGMRTCPQISGEALLMGVDRSQRAGRTTTTKYRLESSGDAIGPRDLPKAMVGGCSLHIAPELRATWRNLIHPRCLAGLQNLSHLIDWAVDENPHPDAASQKMHYQNAAQRHGRGATMAQFGFGVCHPYPPVTPCRT